jgi:hypothetical protein
MAKSKQRTVTGAYSEQDFGDTGKDKIRNVSWGPYEGNSTPPVLNVSGYLDRANYDDIGREGFSAPAKFPNAKVQRRRWW